MTMTRSRMLEGTWYDHPEYYDIAFQVYTEREADFIEAACRKYGPFNARRLLEPACGTGRLVTALAARGYEVTGFDLSQPALSYLRRQITRRRLNSRKRFVSRLRSSSAAWSCIMKLGRNFSATSRSSSSLRADQTTPTPTRPRTLI